MTGALSSLAAAMLGYVPRPWLTRQPEPAAFVIDPAALAGPLQVADVGSAADPAAGERYPQTMVLTGQLPPAAPGPRCRPLFPGRLTFLGGAAASRPAADQVSRAAYAGWNTEGVLVVDLHDAVGMPVDPATEAWIRWITAELPEAMPTRMWYGPVRIPASFLFDALPVLAPADAPAGSEGALTTEHRGRIAAFLRGEWGPVVLPAAAAVDDHRAAPWLPEFVVRADHTFDIAVGAARIVTPFDGTAADLDQAAPAGAGPFDPVHPRNGAVPARLVYQVVAAAGGLSEPLPAPLQEMRYHLVRFTRIWRPYEDCSIHFPWQVATLERADGTMAEQRLAAHGLLFHGAPTGRPDSELRFTASLTDRSPDGAHALTWMDGSQANCWRTAGATTPVEIDLSTGKPAHISTRRPMWTLMTAPPYPRHLSLDLCTYLHLRRACRALVDNRIAGGRLSMSDGDPRAAAMRGLINDAFADRAGTFTQALAQCAALLNKPISRLGVAHLYTGDRPPATGPKQLGIWFRPLLEAFFPDEAKAVEVDGSTRRTQKHTVGRVAYNVWQSIREPQGNEGTKCNYQTHIIGRGAPGALVMTGLADGFFLSPQEPPEANADQPAYVEEQLDRLIDGALQSGASLQLWKTPVDFLIAKARLPPDAQGNLSPANGHSPVFTGLLPDSANPERVEIIDQFARRSLAITDSNGFRQIAGYLVYIAAEWAE